MSLKEQLKEEAKNERKKLSTMSWRDKLWYIWEYYKFHIIGVAIFLTVSISIGTTVVKNNYETAFYCAIINARSAAEANTDYLEKGFKEYLQVDEKTQVIVDSSLQVSYENPTEMGYAVMAKITALVASKELDAMISDPDNIEHYAAVGGLADLEQILPADALDLVKEHLFYAVDDTGRKYACAISLEDTDFEEETGLSLDPPYLAFMANSVHTDSNIALIHYMFE